MQTHIMSLNSRLIDGMYTAKVTWSQRPGGTETFPPLFTLVESAGFSEITGLISTDTCLQPATGLFRY